MISDPCGYSCSVVDSGSKADREMFCSLPSRVDKKTELQLLSGNHPLNDDFDLVPLMVHDLDGHVRARAALAFYPSDDTAYLGLFASKNDNKACGLLMKAAEQEAKKRSAKRIVGPVDTSVWIGFRFKVDAFSEPAYQGEPRNPSFYPELWKMCGFRECARFRSELMQTPDPMSVDPKCVSRLNRASDMGYRFEHPSFFGLGASLMQIRKLACRLFSNMDIFYPVSRRQFSRMFFRKQLWMDRSMVFLVYPPEGCSLAGFLVCLPEAPATDDEEPTLKDRLAARKFAKRYIVALMGVAPGHEGLAAALAQLLHDELANRKAEAVLMPVATGKTASNFYSELSAKTLHYALYEKKLF